MYRGPSLPELGGTYFFADHSGPIWSLRWSGVGASDLESRESELFPDDGPASISSFGEDAAGELYLVNLTPGEVYRVARKAEAGVAPPAARATAAHRALPKRGRFRSLRWTKAARAPAAPSAARVARAASADAIARAVAELGIPEVEDARTPVEEARFLLQAAAEIEHALLVQYLYGAYSLHVPAGAGVRDWRNWIVQIAREEMGHLLTVQNLLLAIGGSLHLDREDPTPDPGQAQAYPFPLRLQPLTLSSLAKYVTTESPLPEQLAPDVRARAEAAFALCRSTIGIGINHVGVLYARIYWLFQPDEIPQGPWRLPVGVFPDRHLKPTDFVATSLDRQADPSEGWQGADQGPLDGTIYVKTIPSLADGLQAIHYIAKQGEGWESSDNDDTHFERFLRIFEQFVLHLEQGGVYPTLPVPVNPFTSDPASPEPAAEQNRITYLPARLWADLFDLRYRMLVLELWLLMSLPRTDERRSLLIDHAIRVEMRIAIRQIAARLVGLPRKDEAPGESSSGVAAPPFRLAPGPLPTDAEGQRQMLRECMSAAATIAQQLESPENRQLLKQLRNADADLATALGT